MSTDRMIRIKDCDDCPHLDHTGAFGRVAYVPCCNKKHGKELPYTPDLGRRATVTAHRTPGIPDWCPLERVTS